MEEIKPGKWFKNVTTKALKYVRIWYEGIMKFEVGKGIRSRKIDKFKPVDKMLKNWVFASLESINKIVWCSQGIIKNRVS